MNANSNGDSTHHNLVTAFQCHESGHAYFAILSMRLLEIDSEAAGHIAQRGSTNAT